MKASYTVEMNGHPGPSTAFFTPGSGMPAVGEMNKSTQNLINAMEEVCPRPHPDTLSPAETSPFLLKSEDKRC